MKITRESLSKQDGLKLIWNQTHSDFKGSLGGKPSIMLNASHGGGIATVEGLSDDVFEEYLSSAISKKNRDTCKDLAVKVFQHHEDVFKPLGLTDKNCGTINQCCGNFDDIRSLVKDLSNPRAQEGYFSEEVLNQVLKTIDHFEGVFNRPTGKEKALSM
ncbi:hypothetical protein LMH73_025085 [Vibrio splendidus]|nr:hypothetical protein [Vibrio splendidus]MCC4880859.1 hypothetical protein [Vibrio splendidus]